MRWRYDDAAARCALSSARVSCLTDAPIAHLQNPGAVLWVPREGGAVKGAGRTPGTTKGPLARGPFSMRS
ncbi:hypothetical protein SGPA1_50053 [Streptomyces misionensis JCM 4497]